MWELVFVVGCGRSSCWFKKCLEHASLQSVLVHSTFDSRFHPCFGTEKTNPVGLLALGVLQQASQRWCGSQTKIFNVGKHRRQAYAVVAKANKQSEEANNCAADFFDNNNTEAAALREKVAMELWGRHAQSKFGTHCFYASVQLYRLLIMQTILS